MKSRSLCFDFGMSFHWNRPVHRIIIERMPLTLVLGVLTLFFQFIVAIPMGIVCGWMAMRTVFNFFQRREETRFLEGFPESMGIFVRMVRAGGASPHLVWAALRR